MSTVVEIEQAVRQLSPEELAAFRAWFAEFDAAAWDLEFEQDVRAGALQGGPPGRLFTVTNHGERALAADDPQEAVAEQPVVAEDCDSDGRHGGMRRDAMRSHAARQ